MITLNSASHRLDVCIEDQRFEGSTLTRFREEMQQVYNESISTVAVDFDNVEEIDSTGLNELLRLKKRFDEVAASFSLVNVKPSVHKVINILGAAEALNFQPSN